jgi:hypothetical protein
MRKWATLAIVLTTAAHAELPTLYREVDRLIWIVRDLDRTLAAWKPTGLVEVNDKGETEDSATYRGEPATASYRWARGSIGGVPVIWAQPLSGSSAFIDFAKQHGEGVAAILHRAPTREAMSLEQERMKAAGVRVLQSGQLGEDASYIAFDTAQRGKYIVGVVYDEDPAATQPRSITQYAFMVRDHHTVSKYWEKLGWPEMSVTNPQLTETVYQGKPAQFAAALGWQRHGAVVYEWILPVKGPSTWQDHLNTHGEGVHHLAIQVEDMDAAIEKWRRSGFQYAQGGGWGEKGRKGSGRFAYMVSPAAGGLDIELLWNQK